MNVPHKTTLDQSGFALILFVVKRALRIELEISKGYGTFCESSDPARILRYVPQSESAEGFRQGFEMLSSML